MSELQFGLVAIGALVIAGVLVYNHVQERRARDAARRAFAAARADVLMGGAEAPAQAAPPQAQVRAETHGEGEVELDERLDYVIELRPRGELGAAAVREHWQPIRRRHPPRAALSGPDADGAWRAGLQLVSRDGVVSEAELIEFRAAVETMAAALGAAVTAPEMKPAMERARALDALCAETDFQVVLHVVAPAQGALAGAALAEAAAGAGLELAADGRFVQRSPADRIALSLAARDGTPFDAASLSRAAIPAVSLTLDVPHAADTRRAFEAMTRLARHLAAACGGEVVDDNGKALGDAALAAIADHLERVRAALESAGITPGGARAARLFS